MNEATKNTKPFHLTITDNETGETVRELDFDALVGAAHIAEQECAGIVISRCNPMVLAETILSTEKTIDGLVQRDPMAGLALAMARVSTETKIEEEPENQEENEEKGE